MEVDMATQVMPVIGSVPEVFENPEGLYEGDLRWYFPIIASAPNVNAPYHNLRHMLHTTVLCYSAILYQTEIGQPLKFPRELLIGALGHDYGHLGERAKSDDDNIRVAVENLHQYIQPADRQSFGLIASFVRSTRYPYEHGAENLHEAILRDADKAQAFSTAWIQQIGVGLATEMQISIKEMLRRQVAFLNHLKFESEWGRFMFAEHIPAKIEETERVLILL